MFSKKEFVYDVGQSFKRFRKNELDKTLLDLAGKSSSSLSKFENGKFRKLDYLPYYINQCKDEVQLNKLMALLNQAVYNEWKRGNR
jgi:hypothetical protein